jgi:hypothetical protein
MQAISRASKILNVTVGIDLVYVGPAIAVLDSAQNSSLGTQYQSVVQMTLNHFR